MTDIPFTDGSGDQWSDFRSDPDRRPMSKKRRFVLAIILLAVVAVPIIAAAIIRAVS